MSKARFVLIKKVKTGNEVISLANAWGFYFLGLKNGELKKFNADWNEVDGISTGGQIRGISIYGDKIFITSWDRSVYCIAKDMKVVWRKQVDSFPFGISAGKDFVAFTTNSGLLCLLDLQGNTIWEKKFEGALECVMVFGESIYTGTYKGEILAFDGNGKQLWSFNCNDMVKSLSSAEQFFVCTTANGKVLMFRDDGTLYWVRQEISPAIVSDCTREFICVGLFNNTVLLYDKTGKLLQKLEEPTKINSLKFSTEARLVVGTQTANIYQNFPDENVEILYEIMCIGGKCGTFISAELLDACPQCGSEKIISRVVEERRFSKEFD